MKKYFYISVLFGVTFLCQCISVEDITGTYTKKQSYTTIIFNEDHTFSYRYKFEFSELHATGIWKMIGEKEIVLNSVIKNRILTMKIRELKCNKSNRSLIINILHMPESEKEYYKCSIFINGHLYISNHCDSIYRIPLSLPVKSIFLGISGDKRIPNRFIDTLFTERKELNSSCADLQLDVYYRDSLFNYKIIDNEVIKVVHGRLKFQTQDNSQIILYKQ